MVLLFDDKFNYEREDEDVRRFPDSRTGDNDTEVLGDNCNGQRRKKVIELSSAPLDRPSHRIHLFAATG